MYRRANEQINQGLSRGARIVLGTVAALFGALMLLIAPPTDKAIFFQLFGGFCLAIALACITRGRVRQFLGSLTGLAMFAVGIWYLLHEVAHGVFWSERSQPSIRNALLYLASIGLPGAAYAWRARFGLRKTRDISSAEQQDKNPPKAG